MSPPFTDTVFYLPHAVENVEVPICFEGDRKLYHLLWTELLTTDEVTTVYTRVPSKSKLLTNELPNKEKHS